MNDSTLLLGIKGLALLGCSHDESERSDLIELVAEIDAALKLARSRELVAFKVDYIDRIKAEDIASLGSKNAS